LANQSPDVVECLTRIPLAARERLLQLPPTRAGHCDAYAAVPAFGQLELRPTGQPYPDTRAVRIAAWNLERCLYPDAAARLLQHNGVDIALLTEMDIGMLRTGQVHTIGQVAERLGHGYCYGLEFLELNAMEPPVGHAWRGNDNTEGLHGNGIVSSRPMLDPVAIRLDEEADWFTPAAEQRRIGKRMALAVTFEVGASAFVACTVHLENRTDGAGRARQMRTLLAALDDYAGALPVVIGGDLNTAVGPGGHGDPAEPLFAAATERGYDWESCNLVRPTTRISAWSTGANEDVRQLDWFCVRGVTVDDPDVVPALGGADDATVLSDHDMILLTLRF
jgi:endonuclease/exonuclease/phosphatase family metal-dependent hydrolase